MLIKCKISLTALRVKYKIERGYFPMVKRDFVKYNRSLKDPAILWGCDVPVNHFYVLTVINFSSRTGRNLTFDIK